MFWLFFHCFCCNLFSFIKSVHCLLLYICIVLFSWLLPLSSLLLLLLILLLSTVQFHAIAHRYHIHSTFMHFNCIWLCTVSLFFFLRLFFFMSYGILTHDVKLSQTILTLLTQSNCFTRFFFFFFCSYSFGFFSKKKTSKNQLTNRI